MMQSCTGLDTGQSRIVLLCSVTVQYCAITPRKRVLIFVFNLPTSKALTKKNLTLTSLLVCDHLNGLFSHTFLFCFFFFFGSHSPGLAFPTLYIGDKGNKREVSESKKKKSVFCMRMTRNGNRFETSSSPGETTVRHPPLNHVCVRTKVSFVNEGLDDCFWVHHTFRQGKSNE